MSEPAKTYTNGEITVSWKPELCIHSTKCWKGLSHVFNPSKRPWINMQGAETELIRKQVEQCPSGALGYTLPRDKAVEQTEGSIHSETIIEVSKGGPLLVYGNISVKDAAGNETKKNKVTAFCRCGRSSNKPYCDGTHGKIGFNE